MPPLQLGAPTTAHNVLGRWDTAAALKSALPAEDLPPRVAVVGPGELIGDLGVVFDLPQPSTVSSAPRVLTFMVQGEPTAGRLAFRV